MIALNDPALRPLFQAKSDSDRDQALEDIIRSTIEPAIERTLSRRLFTQRDLQDRDDILSTIRLRIVRKLRRLLSSRDEAIKNLSDYVSSLVSNTVYDAMRRRLPERSRLKNRLRYAITHDDRMMISMSPSGQVCALRSWSQYGNPAFLSSVSVNATSAMRNRADPGRAIYELLVASGRPLLLDDAVSYFVVVWNLEEPEEPPDPTSLADPARSPLSLVEDRQYLKTLLEEVRALPELQRTALLLNLRDSDGGSAIAFLILAGATSFEDLAELMGLSAEKLAALWNDLPLDDLTIARRLGRTRQQVINLRKSARQRLLRRLERKGMPRHPRP